MVEQAEEVGCLFDADASRSAEQGFELVSGERSCLGQAVEDAAAKPADAKRLDATKSNIRYSFAMSLSTAESVAGHLTRFIGLTGDPSSINDMYRRYDEVTEDDVMRVAKTYLTRARSTEVTLTGGAQ